MKNTKNILTLACFIILIPITVILGATIFSEKGYAFTVFIITILSIIPLFYAFERKQVSSKELTIISVMVALSSIGRFIFAFLPGFKPITAITIITAIYLGKEAGFAVGSLSAVISNFYFGQGPWTPFQMLSWGLIGLIAGLLSKRLINNKIALSLFGVFAGIFYSFTMDIWTTLWIDGAFNIARYIASITTALPITIEYAISNIVFLLLLNKPIGNKLKRIKSKFGLFIQSTN